MSNVIPYFVLAVVALGFFAICYAVFSRGDSESHSKLKTHRNSHVDHNTEEKNDSPIATESKHGDVTITHAGGTNVYTASIADSTESQSGKGAATNETAEIFVASPDTSFNRRDGKNTHVENTSTGYSLALGNNVDAVTSTESAANNVQGEVLHDESAVVKNENVVTPAVSDETIVMTAVSDIKSSNGDEVTPLMDKTIVLEQVTDELRNRPSSVEDTIAMGESVEAFEADAAATMEVTQMIGGADGTNCRRSLCIG